MNNEKFKKLCFFLPSFRTGGSEKVFIELSNFLLNEKKYEIVFICVNAEGKLKSLLNRKIQLIDLKLNSVFASIFVLKKIIKNLNPDLIITSMTHCNITLLVTKLISNLNFKVILRECASIEQLYPFDIRKPKNLIIRLLIKNLYKYSDCIVSNSKELSIYLKDKFKLKKVEVIHNGYNFEEIKNLAFLEPKFEFLKDYKYIITVARLSEQKGIDVLIKAFKLVKEKINCKLIILGEGDKNYKKEIIDLSKKLDIYNHIHMLGFKYNPYQFIKRSDLFVLSSRVEGLPGALIQALGLKINVISTNSEYGPKEILKNGKLGKLVPVNDHKLLAIEILNLLYNPYKIPNERELDIKRFDIESNGTKYKLLINKILKKDER